MRQPPYIGEKLAAPLIAQTRERYPYWRQFTAEHQDYLYMFLILGISKLREGGRFGFITTEYWLRAGGARPLRRYLARHCAIERAGRGIVGRGRADSRTDAAAPEAPPASSRDGVQGRENHLQRAHCQDRRAVERRGADRARVA